MAYKTDGFVPAWYLDSWGKTGTTAARRLVEVGLWDEVADGPETGWRFHDWDDYQPSSDEIERGREQARIRQRKSREQRRKAREEADR